MSDLDSEMRSLISFARRVENPTLADRARVRKRLATTLGLAVGAAADGASASERAVDSGTHFAAPSLPAAAKTSALLGAVQAVAGKAMLWVALGTVAGGGAWLWSRPSAPAQSDSVASVAQQQGALASNRTPVSTRSPGNGASAAAAAPGRTTESEDAPPVPHGEAAASPDTDGEGAEPSAHGLAEPLRDAAAMPGSGEPPAVGGATPQSVAAQPKATGDVAPRPQRRALPRLSLVEEARELAAVHAALRSGDSAGALVRLDTLERRPGGALREERLAARVLALCELGRVREAEGAARRFQALAPESPLVPRLTTSCAKRALRND